MTKEKPTLTYFEKLIDKFKEAATLKGYEGTPTMGRLSETLQRIQMKELALAKEAHEAMVKHSKGEEISTKFRDLVGKKAPAEKAHVDKILAQANAKGATTLGK